jgi:hypothetical protein
LIDKLTTDRATLSDQLRATFNPAGKTWHEIFGGSANEVFMAWNYARYIEAVTEAGKKAYPLPMYVNCQLPAPMERAGEYPSGGPHPYFLDVWRATAPSLDFFSPDIYWPDFEHWLDRYRFAGNAVFVPETRLESAAYNAFYAYGEAGAFGFSPFNIDGANADTKSMSIADVYQMLDGISDVVLSAQANDTMRGLVLHSNSPRGTRTVALGGYLFDATLARTWPAHTLATDDGAMMIMETAANEFVIAGSGLTVSFARDPDVDHKIGGIASIEEVARQDGQWFVKRRLNGDESNQGRQLMMDAHQLRIFRVKLYAADQEGK